MGTSGPFSQTLTERWNGTTWLVVTSPNPGAEYNTLLAVSSIPGGDVWGVGYMSNSTNGPRVDQTLIEHWNGKSWQVVPSPNVGTNNNDLYGVVALSSTDVWAVGNYISTGLFNSMRVLIEHWDGTQWSVVPGANSNSLDGSLNAITAYSPTNIWAVGSQSVSNSADTLVEHWDGTQWSVVSSPNPASVTNLLYSISIASPTSIWAVGTLESSSSPTQTLIEHWDGKQWSVVSSPDPGSSVDGLSGVVALSANNVWAVGYYVAGNNPGHTLTLHWGGKAWKVISSPNGGKDYNLLDAVVRVPGTTQVWAMGSHFTAGTDQEASLALNRC